MSFIGGCIFDSEEEALVDTFNVGEIKISLNTP